MKHLTAALILIAMTPAAFAYGVAPVDTFAPATDQSDRCTLLVTPSLADMLSHPDMGTRTC